MLILSLVGILLILLGNLPENLFPHIFNVHFTFITYVCYICFQTITKSQKLYIFLH